MMDKLFNRLNIDLDYELLIQNRISLLIYNEEWKEIFKDTKNKDIVKIKRELELLVNKEKKNRAELEKLKTDKKRIIAKIITLSDEINNNNKISDIQHLEESQNKLNELNENIENIRFELEMLPKEIRETNLRLLEVTVEDAYTELEKREDHLENINMELEDLRQKLRKYIVEKFDSEERINKLYSFLHNTLGNEKANELDDIIYERKNRR